MNKVILTLLAVILIAPPSFAGLKPNEKAPDFTLRNGAGKDIALHDITGAANGKNVKGVVLGFFASWCVPCRIELPLINSLTGELNEKGISVVLINVKEDFGTIDALLSELKVDRPLVLSDRTGKTAEKYQIRFFPTTFFIRADGSIVDIIFGEIKDAAELRSSAEKILK